MSGIEGKKGYYLQKTGARVNELLERHYIVPTFTTSPTEDTLSWDDEGHIIYFRVGEIIRVKTPEGYDFYRVKDIKDDRINWVKIDTPSDTYTKDEIDVKFFTKEDASGYISEKLVNYYSKREVDGKIEQTNKSVLEQTKRVDNLGVELKNKASAEQVNKLESGLETTKRSIAEQTTKVTALQSEIKTKASTQSVTQLGDSVNIISGTVAEQTIRTDELEASIETKVSQEVFDATTGDINSEFITVKQTTDAIETAVKSQNGEITAINENVNGLSISLGTIESELDSLRNQMDGMTESFFYDYSPTNDNEPAKTWIEQGKEEEHKGDTFTNTATEGDGAGKSWRWLQDNNGNWGWHPIADTDAQKALLLAAQAQATADGKVSIFYIQPSNYKKGDIWFVHNNDYSPYEKGEILTAIAEGTIFSLSDWESKTRYTEAVKDLDKTMNTTFKDGVLDEAERLTIIEGITALTNEKSAVDARYNITIVNSDFTDDALKNEYKATKATYDSAYNSLAGIVEQIADAKAEGLKDLFDSYTTASENYTEAYSAHNEKETQVTEALMGRLNSASRYLDNITNDGVLTPIEKEQLFEIYRNIAKEYDVTRSNALNYKVWKYNVNGYTEESGLNGGEGRYESYVAFKNAYTAIANVFSSDMWGFTKMGESTTLPEGYTTTLLKSYLDTYYEKYGILTESFSAITAAIEAAQKATEATLKELTDNLLPEEMSTTVGKGVVLSTIIATKDVKGNITAGMNASSSHSHPDHGRVVFVGGAKDINDFNNASYVVYEDGHVKMYSAEIEEYASKIALQSGLLTKANVTDFESMAAIVNTLASMWRLEGGVLKTDYDVLTKGQFASAAVGTEGGGSGFAYLADLYDVALASLASGDILSWNGNKWINIKQSSLVPDLSAYATKSFVTDSLVGYATQSDVTSALSNYLPLTGGTISGDLTIKKENGESTLILGTNGRVVYNPTDDTTSLYNEGSGYPALKVQAGLGHPVFRYNYKDYTLIHSGNIGSYALKTDGSSFLTDALNFNINGKIYRFANNSSGGASWYNGTDWKTIAFTDSTVAAANKLVIGNTATSFAKFAESTVYIGSETHSNYNTAIMGKTVRLYTNGSYYGFIINSSGNVTIGSSDLAGTSAKLYVTGDIRTTTSISALGCISSDRTTGITISGIGTSSDNRWNGHDYSNLILSNSNNAMSFIVDGTTNGRAAMIQVGHNAANYAQYFGTLCLNPLGGNVLIGTTANSGYKLDVAGTLRTTDTITTPSVVVANEISINGIRIDTYGGALRINGDVFSTGQFAASVIGEEGSGGGGAMLLTTWPSVSGDYSGYALGGNLGVELNTRVKTLEGKTITWSEVSNKPSTLSGYGITDALPKTGGILTGAISIQCSADSKIALDNTDSDNKWNNIAFYQNSTLYGRLGTFGSDALAWAVGSSVHTIYHQGNFNPSDYLPLSGGEISANNATPLKIKTTTVSNLLSFVANNVEKTVIGYYASSTRGSEFRNATSGAYIGITDNGTPHYNGNTLYHTGNFNPADYLQKSGGTLTGSLITKDFNSGSDSLGAYIEGKSPAGMRIQYYKGGSRYDMLLMQDGDIKWNGNTLIHSGNIGSYAFIPRDAISSNTDANNLQNGVYLNGTGNGTGNSNFPQTYSIISNFTQSDRYQSQISIGNPNVYVRRKIDTWSEWVELITNKNIGSQSVDKANSLVYYSVSNVNDAASARLFYGSSATNMPASSYVAGLTIPHGDLGYKYQLAFDFNGNLYSRKYGGTWLDWKTIAFTDSDITGNAGSADVIAKTYGGSINYAYNDNKVRLVRETSVDWETNGYPTRYMGGLSAISSYCGWQMITYGGVSDKNPYFRKVNDNGTWSAWKTLAFTDSDITGNAATATKLQTARTIWGQSFDGTGNVDGAIRLTTSDQINGHLGVALNFSCGAFVDTTIWNGDYGRIATFKSNGNVGIGTSNPQYKLDVAGTVRVTDTLTAQNGITTNEITIGGIRIYVENGALKVNGDIYATGQFASGTVGN